MGTPNHYMLLGVAPGASLEQIRAAYRGLAKKLHPDASGAPESGARFALVAAAYEVLSDRQRRRAYDQTLAAGAGNGAGRGRPGGENGAAAGHYTWTNVAAPHAGGAHAPSDISEFDELYETFFGGRGAARAAGGVERTGGKVKGGRRPKGGGAT